MPATQRSSRSPTCTAISRAPTTSRPIPPARPRASWRSSSEQWATRGYGPFAIFEKGGTALIGRGGLFWIEALQDVEINYMFDPTVWGRGYALEVAAEFLAFGFGRHGLRRMVATTNPANAASAQVLRKVGMKPAGQKDLGGGRIVDLHEIDREAWRMGQAAGDTPDKVGCRTKSTDRCRA